MILKIIGIETDIEIIPGEATELVIENTKLFYDVSKSFVNLDEEIILLYNPRKLKNDFILVITDLFNLNPNNKKVLSSTYKYAENMLKTDEEVGKKLFDLNNKANEILFEVSELFDNQNVFDYQITISDLLNVYNFKFEFNDSSFIELFVSFIKIISLSANYKVIVTFNIQDLLSEYEFDLLNKELGYLGLTLINLCNKKSNLRYKKTIIIDKDLCEI